MWHVCDPIFEEGHGPLDFFSYSLKTQIYFLSLVGELGELGELVRFPPRSGRPRNIGCPGGGGEQTPPHGRGGEGV